MDFYTFFSKAPTRAHQASIDHPSLRIPGLTFSKKPYFQEILPPLAKRGQNVLLLGQSNTGKSYFLKQLVSIIKPKRLVVISNSSARQYQQDRMDLKHYSPMPESIDETSIKPESYVIIDDIRVMGLKHGSQRECLDLYKFFTMYSHHHKLNVFFLSQSFDNIKDMKINAHFLYLFGFTDRANIKRYIYTLFGGKCNKSSLVYPLYETLLEKCERPALAIDCSHNKYYTYCDGQSLKVDFEF